MLDVVIPPTYETPTPIAVLVPHLFKAITNIAPERINAFQREFPDLTFEVLDTQKWIARVDVPTKHIQVSTKVAEVLWSAGLAYFLVYQTTRGNRGGMTLIPQAGSDLQRSLELLSWSVSSIQPENGLRPEVGVWPGHCQCPCSNPVPGSNENVADELMLCMLAFVLHHELAHIRLRHGRQNVDSERDADYAASDWILGGVDRRSSFYIKRVLGIAARLSLAAGRSTHSGEYSGQTHPRTFDRLFQVLDRHLSGEPDHIAWYFTSASLALHLSNTDGRLQTPPEEFVNGKEAVNQMIELLARDERVLDRNRPWQARTV